MTPVMQRCKPHLTISFTLRAPARLGPHRRFDTHGGDKGSVPVLLAVYQLYAHSRHRRDQKHPFCYSILDPRVRGEKRALHEEDRVLFYDITRALTRVALGYAYEKRICDRNARPRQCSPLL